MSAQHTATWVRVGDRWIRADHIVGARLEPDAAPRPRLRARSLTEANSDCP
ncbi:hypothetical protein [Streptomyces sp. NPDC053048]|uniref:hypothetical protein n=1 Tax=Streptomyces sp. NPDC053048 TaxID=3365694 RepID=UPI0037D8353F